MSQAPDELVKLKALLMKLQQENQVLAADKKSLTADNQALESKLEIISAEIVTLKDKLELALAQLNLNRAKRFGVQSEKTAKGTFNEAEQNANTSPAHHKKGRRPLPNDLPKDVKTYAIDEPICEGCGHELHACGVEESEQVKIVPAHISVIKHRCTKYACRHCENTMMSSKITRASKPKQPIPGSI